MHYGATAKTLHWLIVALLVTQYLIGWLMPDIHRGMSPGAPMILHISVGIVILALIVARLVWRLVASETSLPRGSACPRKPCTGLLVLATTLSGWLFASARGWKGVMVLRDAAADAHRR